MILQVISYIITVSFATIFPPFTAVPIELSAAKYFGVVPALIYTIGGNLLGSTVVFFISRKYGWPLLYALFDDNKVEKAKKIVHSYSFWHITFTRMLFSSFWDVLSYAIGLSRLNFKLFFLSSLFSTIPTTSIIIIFGNTIDLNHVYTIWLSIGLFVLAIYVLFMKLRKKKK